MLVWYICPMVAPPKIKHSKRRDEILRMAAQLFKEKGFAASTMRVLADRVGLEAASLYNHIRSKEDILAAICFGMAERYDAMMADLQREDISPIEQIKRLISNHIDLALQYPNETIVMDSEWSHMQREDRQRYRALISRYESQIINMLNTGMDNGSIALAHPRILMYSMLSSLKWLGAWYHPKREIPKEEINKTIQDLIIMGISQ